MPVPGGERGARADVAWTIERRVRPAKVVERRPRDDACSAQRIEA
jgi:hypothetical protein